MANNTKKKPAITFGVFVDNELEKRGSTRRWLMAQLIQHGITLTDTQLSNRCTGFVPFQENEMSAIEKVLEANFTLE